jgi:Cu/Ag efflux pump CusA
MDRLIRFAVSRRLLVLSLVAVIAGAGVYSFQQHGCSHLQPAEQAAE